MIVQAPGADGLACVFTLAQHQALAAQLADAFGNAQFAPPAPREQMLFAVAHHDSGWAQVDQAPPAHAASGLPCSLGQHPLPLLLDVASRSIALNEAQHPYCGLLVSLHQAGLYNGRLGLTMAPPAQPPASAQAALVEAFLARERSRQRRLCRHLRAQPAWRAAAAPRALLDNYLLLQFFDRLALYLNLGGGAPLRPALLDRVPTGPGASADIAIRPGIDGITLSPFPFGGDTRVSCSARVVAPQRGATGWAGRLAAAPTLTQVFYLRRSPP
jgi:hypothetical protein